MLSEALPYMQRYDRKTFVVKYGGHAMGDPRSSPRFRPRHRAAEAGRHQPDRGAWRRPADRPTCSSGSRSRASSSTACASPTASRSQVVEMVLVGCDQQGASSPPSSQGGKAIGISGKDGGSDRAQKPLERRWRDPSANIEQIVDLGFVGDPAAVDHAAYRRRSLIAGLIPVVAPIAGRARRRDLQHQCRHLRGGAIAAAAGRGALVAADRCAGRARPRRAN